MLPPRRGHTEDVQDIAWAPDASALATCSIDHNTVLWSAEGGRGVARLQDHRHYVQGAAWDPAARFLVTQSSDRTCRRAPRCLLGCGFIPRTKLFPELTGPIIQKLQGLGPHGLHVQSSSNTWQSCTRQSARCSDVAARGRVYAPRPPLAGKKSHKAAASRECLAGLKDLIAVKTLCKRPLATSATAGAGLTQKVHSGSPYWDLQQVDAARASHIMQHGKPVSI